MTSKIIPLNPRIALAGSVNSSKKILEKLIEHNMNVVQTLGLDPKVSKNVSGYQDLMPIAEKANIPFSYFEKLNDEGIVDLLKSKDVDLLFVVGLSQIVKDPLLSVPKFGCIGYHPTKLPEGRGRGAIAWIILGKAEPAASFFAMDEGMDSGALLAQEPLTLEGNEYP
jgi:methionyl-tRNA formyltransferase